MVLVSGAVGGFFGLPGLIVELPISTTLMLRSIADIAEARAKTSPPWIPTWHASLFLL